MNQLQKDDYDSAKKDDEVKKLSKSISNIS